MKPFTQRELASEYKRRTKQERINTLRLITIEKNKQGFYSAYKFESPQTSSNSSSAGLMFVVAIIAIILFIVGLTSGYLKWFHLCANE